MNTALQQEAAKGDFQPCSELELMLELKAFIENLSIDADRFITHHTSSTNLNCRHFLANKQRILEALEYDISSSDLDELAHIRQHKHTL